LNFREIAGDPELAAKIDRAPVGEITGAQSPGRWNELAREFLLSGGLSDPTAGRCKRVRN